MFAGGLTSFYRPDFQRVLLRHLSRRCKLHTSKRFVSYANGGDRQPIQLYFEDGTTATCDLLVAADGLKSAVRACMLKGVAARLQAEGKRAEATEALRHVMPSWSGMMAYRTSIDADVLRKKYPGHRVLTTPQLVSAILTSRDLHGPDLDTGGDCVHLSDDSRLAPCSESSADGLHNIKCRH